MASHPSSQPTSHHPRWCWCSSGGLHQPPQIHNSSSPYVRPRHKKSGWQYLGNEESYLLYLGNIKSWRQNYQIYTYLKLFIFMKSFLCVGHTAWAREGRSQARVWGLWARRLLVFFIIHSLIFRCYSIPCRWFSDPTPLKQELSHLPASLQSC